MSSVKKSLVVYGNCQAGCIRGFLKRVDAFEEQFDLAVLPGVHEVSANQVDALHAAASKADVFIYQNVSNNYRGNKLSSEYLLGLLKPGAIRLSYPSLYFGPYFPNLTYLNDGTGAMLRGPGGDYHDVNILRSFSLGESALAAVSRLEDGDTYDAQQITDTFDSWVENMRAREHSLDIHASAFIADAYQDQRLFFVYNHPLNSVMIDICQQIAKALNLPLHTQALASLPDWLSSTSFPIHPSVYAALHLRFPLDKTFNMKSARVRPDEAVDRFFKFYAENPDVIAAFHRKFG